MKTLGCFSPTSLFNELPKYLQPDYKGHEHNKYKSWPLNAVCYVQIEVQCINLA